MDDDLVSGHKAIIDWQGPLLGRGMVDVCLILGQSTRIEVRRQHEKALLQRYLNGLEKLGVTYVNDAWNDYRLAHLYNWIYVIVVSGALDSSNAKAFAWMSQMIARQSAVHTDLQLQELLQQI